MWVSTFRHSARRHFSLALSEGERGLWCWPGLDCPPTAAGDRQLSAPSPPSCRLNHLPEIDSVREENEASKGDTIDAHRSLQHTSAYVRIRQHPSASVSIRQHPSAYEAAKGNPEGIPIDPHCSMQHTSTSVSIRQHTSAYVSVWRHARERCAPLVGTVITEVCVSN
jgi:hypothetical protein